ncbi:MAG: pyruvate, phosphate dikinase [Bacteroidales bacterium]|nr:pyruvate, phosphate dikinase [Bacteroidales bacterium]
MPENETSFHLSLLETINKANRVVAQLKDVDETMTQLVETLPERKGRSRTAFFRIIFEGREYKTSGLVETNICSERSFKTSTGKKVHLQFCVTRDEPEMTYWLKEQSNFLNSMLAILTKYLNSIERKEKAGKIIATPRSDDFRAPIGTRFLQKFLNKNTYNRDVYHDLMPFKVSEILLISSLYDAYAIEKEGRFSEHMLGQYGQLNLTSFPRITGASSAIQALELLKAKHFDLIIYMVGVDKQMPILVSEQIKKDYPYIPIFLLLNNNVDVSYFTQQQKKYSFIDNLFVWNGDANIFFSMIKLLEDQVNVWNDTSLGQVRVILFVEDSPIYYSRYLSFMYRVLMAQTKRIIDDVSSDELYKVLRMRARPKLLLATSYEEALEIIDNYKKYMLCLITDVKFEKDGAFNENAGVELLNYVHKEFKNLPTILQSSDLSYKETAEEYGSFFIHKHSETLYQDFEHFITNYLGFGDFEFKDKAGHVVAVANSMKSFEKYLKVIPDESLVFHASHNHFSMWLMARGEIKAASFINPKKVTDFASTRELRNALLGLMKEYRNEQESGNILPFSEELEITEKNIYLLGDGSMGGKGRGLSFVNALINNFNMQSRLPGISIRTPKTFVIGTSEFESFIKYNDLSGTIVNEQDFSKLKKTFISGSLSHSLETKLGQLLEVIQQPLAVRSSGLFEDSLAQPFAGIFDTYLLPNNHPDKTVRLRQLGNAIKLVFASVYSDTVKAYAKAIDYKLEEEKMAVVIQEVVGERHEDLFYPSISGVAQSYNYYSFAHMKPEEGFAVAAVGLGRYVVEGNKAYRFSPKYPGTEIYSPKDQFRNSQVRFYAVDLTKKNLDLLEGEAAGLAMEDVSVAERHGSLKHCASVYNPDSDTIYPGLTKAGPRILNFANVLKYNYTPLAKTLEVVLELGKDAMGTAIEIEYAVDLRKDKNGRASFYILQIKPLISNSRECNIDLEKIVKENIILYSEQGMGNGYFNHISDVIYVDPERFDKTKTLEMAGEIEAFNDILVNDNRQYVLIGPGRWGTRDRWIGIPVKWYQISNAKVIVETSVDDYPLDASSGSHFFHNVTSMNVGYFTVQHQHTKSRIEYQSLGMQKVIKKGKFFTHVRFEHPLHIEMDGKKRIFLIHQHSRENTAKGEKH